MNEIINFYIKSFGNLSKSLKKKAMFVEKPWALIDDNGAIQKLIFKRNQGLIMSTNGSVSEGTWEYYAEAKALLIDRGTDKLLLKEQYVDSSVLILKKDGTENDFFILANENNLPDYNVGKYLNSIKCKEFKILELSLLNDCTLQIYNGIDSTGYANFLHHKVEIIDNGYNNKPVENGSYITKSKDLTFTFEDSKIKNVSKNLIIRSIDNISYEIIDGGLRASYNLDKRVTINGKPVHQERIVDEDDVIYDIKDSKICNVIFLVTHRLSNGFIVKVEQANQDKIARGDRIVESVPTQIPNGKYKLTDTWFKHILIKDCVVQ